MNIDNNSLDNLSENSDSYLDGELSDNEKETLRNIINNIYEIDLKEIENKTKINKTCSICLLSLEEDIEFLKCGHSLHSECCTKLLEYSYKCPECYTTIKDMSEEFKKLDIAIDSEPESIDKEVLILCNDCHTESFIKYHHYGLKCKNCGSYNTRE
jgi:hypothetical protein